MDQARKDNAAAGHDPLTDAGTSSEAAATPQSKRANNAGTDAVNRKPILPASLDMPTLPDVDCFPAGTPLFQTLRKRYRPDRRRCLTVWFAVLPNAQMATAVGIPISPRPFSLPSWKSPSRHSVSFPSSNHSKAQVLRWPTSLPGSAKPPVSPLAERKSTASTGDRAATALPFRPPRSGATVVDSPLSSMKISLSGSRSDCRSCRLQAFLPAGRRGVASAEQSSASTPRFIVSRRRQLRWLRPRQ
jgi:hypothetical protein